MRSVLAGLAIALAFATPAQARTTLSGGDALGALAQSWADSSLAPTPNVVVTVATETCPEPHATWCMDPRTNTVWTGGDYGYLWDPGYSERDRLVTQLTFLHELGHVYDLGPGIKPYRKRFARVMGYRKDWSWRRGAYAGRSWVLPFEQFAMAYGFCSLYAHYEDAAYARSVWFGYRYEPSRDQFERGCYVIRTITSRPTQT